MEQEPWHALTRQNQSGLGIRGEIDKATSFARIEEYFLGRTPAAEHHGASKNRLPKLSFVLFFATAMLVVVGLSSCGEDGVAQSRKERERIEGEPDVMRTLESGEAEYEAIAQAFSDYIGLVERGRYEEAEGYLEGLYKRELSKGGIEVYFDELREYLRQEGPIEVGEITLMKERKSYLEYDDNETRGDDSFHNIAFLLKIDGEWKVAQ